LAGALASAKQNIPVAHVEAGLRSFKKSMPEEINRVLTDHVSSLLFCPTPTSVKNLKREGITRGIHLVGDVMYDSLREYLSVAEKKSKVMNKLKLQKKGFYLMTIHRAENTDIKKNLKEITQILTNLDGKVVFPIHPRTRKRLAEFKFLDKLASKKDLNLIDPVSYLDMLILEKNAKAVLTDSGGVQKEAFFLRIPCLTLREETEWVETVERGWNKIVGLDEKKIKRAKKKWDRLIPLSSRRSKLTSRNASSLILRLVSNFQKGRGT
jgi:UDP-N-acetylglucosamine 2-epimerase